jgi:DNA-binding transcriptional MerR regulator
VTRRAGRDPGTSTFRIGEVAALSGFSRDAIRYYERLGLLGRPLRTDAGYRVYGEQSLKRLRVISNARRFGFSLAEIRDFMKVRDSGGAPCAEVRRAAERRLGEVDDELRHLERLRDAMQRTLNQWDAKLSATAAGGRARLLEDEVALPEPGRSPRTGMRTRR